MTIFEYTARDEQSRLIKGTMDAASNQDVAKKLHERGILPIKIEKIIHKKGILETLTLQIGLEKVTIDELIIFSKQMYALSKAGIPIINALSRLAATTRSKLLRKTLQKIVEDISSGQTFAAAMRQHTRVFPPIYISIIDAGENSGNFDAAFSQMANYLSLESKTIRSIKSALRYPTVVMIALLISLIVINFMVVPAFSRMFSQFKAELPLITRGMIAFSDFLIAYWLHIISIAFAVFISFRLWAKTTEGHAMCDYLKLKIPFVGSIVRRTILARFARTFVMVLQASIPLQEGMKLVANAMGNEYFRKRTLAMLQYIGEGETLTGASRHSGLFTPLVLEMLSVGEETGSLQSMLEEIASYYEQEVEYALSKLSTAIEPILLTVLGIIILLVALSVYLPMWNMVSFVKN